MPIKHPEPTVTVRSLAVKVQEGFDSQGWKIVGTADGTQVGALLPLIRYLVSRGVRVHHSNGLTFK